MRDGLVRVLQPYIRRVNAGWIFRVHDPDGPHVLRVAARYQAMLTVRRTRFDAEGVHSLDPDASSIKGVVTLIRKEAFVGYFSSWSC